MIQKVKSNTKICLGCDTLFAPYGGENCCSRDCALKANLAILSTEHSHLSLPKRIHGILTTEGIDYFASKFEKTIFEKILWEEIVKEL